MINRIKTGDDVYLLGEKKQTLYRVVNIFHDRIYLRPHGKSGILIYHTSKLIKREK